MFRSLDIKQLASRIDMLDSVLLSLVATRMNLALSVGALKKSEGKGIYDRGRERHRLDTARFLAVNGLGINDDFAHALMHLIINESTKQQLIQLQSDFKPVDTKTDEEWHAHLKQNLLKLTAAVVRSYDADYSLRHFAIGAYREFEDACITSAISDTHDRVLALDLGCATGSQSLRLSDRFQRVIGYDICPFMIAAANMKLTAETENIRFEEWDLEQGIPLPDASVSFVNMNLGTASDIPNIGTLMSEIARVLKKGGRYLLSFYNADALVYSWNFLPWPDGLTAEINASKSCLDVRIGNEIFSVYAKSFTQIEIQSLLGPSLSVDVELASYPTVSAVLPDQLFAPEQTRARETVLELDQHLSTLHFGAYTIATGRKA